MLCCCICVHGTPVADRTLLLLLLHVHLMHCLMLQDSLVALIIGVRGHAINTVDVNWHAAMITNRRNH